MTDRSRALVAAIALVVVATAWTAWLSTGALTPEREAEREGEGLLSLYQVHRVDPSGRVLLAKGGRQALVDGLPDDVAVGEELSVAAIPGDGVWTATWVERHPHRPAKRWLGIAGLVFTAVMLGATVRRRDGWVWFRG